MRDVLQRIMELQPEWSSKNTPAMDERGLLVRHAGPDWLGGFSGELAAAIGIPDDDLIVEGRDGMGPKTEVPWFRFGSVARSPSATIGWYCVYLFDTEGTSVYLTVGHGSTEWNGVEFKPRDHDELRQQAAWARGVLADTADGLTSSISLESRRSPLGPGYEAGTVVAIEYSAHSIPEPSQLKIDALRMAELLRNVYEAEDNDPSAPVIAPEVRLAVETADLTAGKRKSASSSAGFQPDAVQRKAIETRGMVVAREALIDWGWDRVSDTSSSQPYDFHCEAGDEELFVEVKATTSDGASVILTRGEVEHVRTRFPDTALAIVSGVEPPAEAGEPASGGTLALIHPWQVNDSALSVISYIYKVPTAEVETWK